MCAILTQLPSEYQERSRAPTTPLHAQTGAIVASLAACLDVTPNTRPRYTSVLAGVLAGLPIAVFSFLLGVFWQDRGWAALIVFAIVLAAVTIRGRNTR